MEEFIGLLLPTYLIQVPLALFSYNVEKAKNIKGYISTILSLIPLFGLYYSIYFLYKTVFDLVKEIEKIKNSNNSE